MPSLPSTFTRREFIGRAGRGLGLLAFSPYAPYFLSQSALAKVPAPEKDRSILVLVQLAGGNDGLNTVVPYQNTDYYDLRPTLALRGNDLLPLNDQIAFPRVLDPLFRLFQEGKLKIIQNVGYPNPNRSHFRSMEIWETGSDADVNLPTGWLGRFFDNACSGVAGEDPIASHFGDETPLSFLADKPHALHGIGQRRGQRQNPRTLSLLEEILAHPPSEHDVQGSFLRHTMLTALAADRKIEGLLNANQAAASYPDSRLANELKGIAGLIAGGLDTRVYFASLGGFDTHSNQAGNHQRLMTILGGALAAFQKDLEARGLADQVLTMTFSEFGRRANENGSRGTDHGAAAPLFIMGNRCAGDVIGEEPYLDLAGRVPEVRHQIDFRQVYATILEDWFHCGGNLEQILGQSFSTLPFLAKAGS